MKYLMKYFLFFGFFQSLRELDFCVSCNIRTLKLRFLDGDLGYFVQFNSDPPSVFTSNLSMTFICNRQK